MDLTDDSQVIAEKYEKFVDLRSELERCEPRVMSLQEAADQLLRHSPSAPEGSTIVLTRLTDLRLRLQSLRRLTCVYILKLGAVLGRDATEIGITLATPTSSIGTSLHSLSYDVSIFFCDSKTLLLFMIDFELVEHYLIICFLRFFFVDIASGSSNCLRI